MRSSKQTSPDLSRITTSASDSPLVSALKRGREGRTLPGIRAGEPERQTIRGAVVPRERRR
jgi:hypothetical protein